mgnify:CR=1 FL=1
MSEQGAADPGGAAGAADEETGQVVPRHAGKTRDVSAGFVNGQLRLGEQAGHQGGVPVPMVWRDKGVGLQIAGQQRSIREGRSSGRKDRIMETPFSGAGRRCPAGVSFFKKTFLFSSFLPKKFLL